VCVTKGGHAMCGRRYAGYYIPMLSYVGFCGAMLALNYIMARRLRRVITAPVVYKYPVYSGVFG
jgi:hypothetical protein